MREFAEFVFFAGVGAHSDFCIVILTCKSGIISGGAIPPCRASHIRIMRGQLGSIAVLGRELVAQLHVGVHGSRRVGGHSSQGGPGPGTASVRTRGQLQLAV